MRREWGALVKLCCQNILQATTIEDRSLWMRALVFLPHAFLPVKSSTSHVLQHLSSGKPFNIEFSTRDLHSNNNNTNKKTNDQSPKNQQQQKIKRNAERVEALAKNLQLRKATNFMLQNADMEIINNGNEQDPAEEHEERIESLKSKFPKEKPGEGVEMIQHHVAPVNGRTLYQALKGMSKSATNSIDGWTIRLLTAACVVDHSISEDLGQIVAMIATSVKDETEQENNNSDDQQQQHDAAAADQHLTTMTNDAAKQQQQTNNRRNNNNNNNSDKNNNKNDSSTVKTTNVKKWCKYFDDFTTEILRSGRLVGIKKAPGNYRPVVILNFFAKITGLVTLKRANIDKKIFNFNLAMNVTNGAKIIGFKTRQQYEKGKAIAKIDISNMFNALSRKKMQQAQRNVNIDKDIQSFFCSIYGGKNKLALYGPGGRVDVLEMEVGCCQGESQSAVTSCLLMEEFCQLVKEKFPDDDILEILCYMDDGTFICDRSKVRVIIQCIINAARKCGFKINLEKSSVICKNGIPDPAPGEEDLEMFTVNNPNEEFKMLGMLINDNLQAYQEYNNSINTKVNKFFDSLDEISLHTELKHQILMFCGTPRLLYYCETTPSHHANEVVLNFQRRLKNSFARMVDVKDLATIRDDIIYNVHGASLPNYLKHYSEIFNKSTTMIATGNMGRLMVKLVEHGLELFTSPECLHDRHWTQYRSPTRLCQLESRTYKIALAIRCKLIPDSMRNEMASPIIRCLCDDMTPLSNRNNTLLEEQQMKTNKHQVPLLEHVMGCNAVNKHFYTERHEYVKEAVMNIARSYGISCTPEPTMYVYATGQHNRPDIIFHLPSRSHLTTDITVVHSAFSGDPNTLGVKAAEAEMEKNAKHKQAVNALGHTFIPFAIETNGHLGQGAIAVMNEIAKYVAFEMRFDFKRDMRNAVSTALARYRAEVLTYVLTQTSLNRART
jgi:hypothetical protein